MLYLLGYALKINVFTLAAEYAAVTTPAFELSATADGRVTLLADLASGQLAKGQAVARIADPRLETEIETLKAEAALQESRLRILRQQEQSLSTVYGSYADIAAALSQQKQADLKAAQAQLTEHQARLRRTQDLHKRGLTLNEDRIGNPVGDFLRCPPCGNKGKPAPGQIGNQLALERH